MRARMGLKEQNCVQGRFKGPAEYLMFLSRLKLSVFPIPQLNGYTLSMALVEGSMRKRETCWNSAAST
jgi:hypothetical protein